MDGDGTAFETIRCCAFVAPQEPDPVMATATLILSQYLYGNPGWDGPKAVEAIRNLVSRFS
jgi:hypothetical protein